MEVSPASATNEFDVHIDYCEPGERIITLCHWYVLFKNQYDKIVFDFTAHCTLRQHNVCNKHHFKNRTHKC